MPLLCRVYLRLSLTRASPEDGGQHSADVSRGGIVPEYYVNVADLSHILSLLEKKTRRAAEKAEDWKREVMLQDEIFVKLRSDEKT
jgi:hypothetical protein